MKRLFEKTKIFTVFFDETRLKILGLLRDGEKCASMLLKQINVGQSTLSYHMKTLIESGLVTARKVHKWTYYSICESGKKRVMKMLKQLENLI